MLTPAYAYTEPETRRRQPLQRRIAQQPAPQALPQRGIVGTAAAPSPNPITPVKPRPPGMTNTPGSVPSGAQASVDAARAKLAQVGSNYSGSVYGAPGSYTEARPVRPAFPGPGSAPGRGGVDVRSYTGSLYNGTATPDPNYRPQPSAEDTADRVLRARFGPPPNERGQIDIADASGVRSVSPYPEMNVPAADSPALPSFQPSGPLAPQMTGLRPAFQPTTPPQQTEAANPLSGTSTTQPEAGANPYDDSRNAGFNQRGTGTPRGQDAMVPTVPGKLLAPKFASGAAQNAYSAYVRKLFGDPQIA
jgi:hypothetical protein